MTYEGSKFKSITVFMWIETITMLKEIVRIYSAELKRSRPMSMSHLCRTIINEWAVKELARLKDEGRG